MILLKNCAAIATFNDTFDELKNTDILISENKIKKISKNIILKKKDLEKVETLDCSSSLVIPGLINTHHHFFQILTRNIPAVQNAELFNWLTHLYPIWSKLDRDCIYYSTIAATCELLKTGCTTTTDHMYLYPESLNENIVELQFQGAEKTGIRFAPSRGSMTKGKSQGGLPPDDVVQKPDEVIKDMKRTIERFHDPSPFSMKRIILAPCSPFSVDKQVMLETVALARQYKVILHTHLAETLDENNYCLELYGKRPLSLMKDWNWLGEDVFFAHGIWFEDNELDILKMTNTGISHCPTSNMRLGSGIARVKDMLNLNIRIGLGVDGSASNDSSDMLGEVRNAMLLQRVKYGGNALSSRHSLQMATRGGASLLGFDKIGQIKKGFSADIAIFNLNKLQHAGSLSDPLSAIVFTGYNHETEYTIVNGKILVRKGKIVYVDEEKLISKVNSLSKNLLSL